MKQNKCGECEHNVMGECVLIGREIPISYVMNRMQQPPKWCPKEK